MPELTIERLSHDGKGIARSSGKVAFVAGALAGEVVKAELVQRHRRFDEYRLLEVLQAAADRVEPPCPLVGRCGGCDLQHLSGPAQLTHKSATLVEQIRRQSGLVPESLAAPLAALPFGYRRRARLAIDLPRRGGRLTLGLRAAGAAEVVAIDSCPVLSAELAVLPGQLQQLLGTLERPAVLGHVELSLSEVDAATALPVVLLRMVAPPADGDRSRLREFAERERLYLALRVADGALEYLHRPLPEDPGYRLPEFDLRLCCPPGGFVQGNAEINRALVSRVVDWALAAAADRVLDAFCGVGNFALPLARRGATVLGLEVSTEAVTAARHNAARHGLGNAAFEVRDLQADDPALPGDPFAVAVLDPPRTGARQLVTALAARKVASIVYVSCAPATLARDAAILADAGYVLEELCLVDMFPQTSHIESVSRFRLERRRARRR